MPDTDRLAEIRSRQQAVAREDVRHLLAAVDTRDAMIRELSAQLAIRDSQVDDLSERLAEAEHSLDASTSDEQAGAPA